MIGFEEIEKKLINNFNSNKLHHGIIIAGKRGIGKASFVKNFCHKVLNNRISDSNSLNYSSDIAIIEKLTDKKNIGIETIRQKQHFLNHTSGTSDYRFLIIDAVCELTQQASNAILKSLEEPKKNCLIILIAHQLGRVLPTIKSRCLIIKVPNFSKSQFFSILEMNNLQIDENEKEFLSEISENCPALAIEFSSDLIKFYDLFVNSVANKKIDNQIFKMLSDKNFSYQIVERSLLYFLSKILKKTNNLPITNFNEFEINVMDQIISKFDYRHITEMFDYANSSFDNLQKFNLDKKNNFLNVFNKILYV